MQHTKIQKTLYIEIGVYEKAKQIWGERHISSNIQRLLELELAQKCKCRTCDCEFTDVLWDKDRVPRGECPACGKKDIALVF